MTSENNWKILGNDAFKKGDFASAIENYSRAIELEPEDPKPLVNRSIAHASLQQWKESALDARRAIQLDPKYTKAHFRFVKALLAIKKIKDARYALSMAFKECGEQTKEFKDLEQEVFAISGIPLRPKSTDFEVMSELGDGNFSKVYKTFLKSTKQVFAVKAIERVVIDKMKRRHPNIHNEILMEKRVLHKLEHPGIVPLYCTFQDAGTLYYMNEYLGGGDLWTHLHEVLVDKQGKGSLVGMHWSLLRFYFAQMISAVEHMHQRGIIHRDIKPENIMITEQGYLKFVDFGTAKDLIEVNLNGPEFVGTPEYMCPGTINVKRASTVGIEADLWALGVTLYQMVLGYTPFAAPSPFLTFLRIKRAKLEIPSWVPDCIADLLHILLSKDDFLRVGTASTHTAPVGALGSKAQKQWLQASNVAETQVSSTSALDQDLKRLSYDALREHAFFSNWTEQCIRPNVIFFGQQLQEEVQDDVQDTVSDVDNTQALVRDVYAEMATVNVRVTGGDENNGWQTRTVMYPTSTTSDYFHDQRSTASDEMAASHIKRPLPSLHDLCLRAVADAAVKVAFTLAEHGGVRPAHIPWMQRFNLAPPSVGASAKARVSSRDRSRIMHFLHRRQKLHLPSVYRLFFQSLPDSRCLRADPETLEYVGLNRVLQGQTTGNSADFFHFAMLFQPRLGQSHQFLASNNSEETREEIMLKSHIAHLNKLRPKFIVITGPFVSLPSSSEEDNALTSAAMIGAYRDKFRKHVSRVSDTMSVLFVPSPFDLSYSPVPNAAASSFCHPSRSMNRASLLHYRQQFGADFFGFWYDGMRGLVLNSSLFFHLSSTVSNHSNFSNSTTAAAAGLGDSDEAFLQAEAQRQWLWLEEEIEQCKLCATSIVVFTYHPWYLSHVHENPTETDEHMIVEVIPPEWRVTMLQWMRHHKIRFVSCGVTAPSATHVHKKPFSKHNDGSVMVQKEDLTNDEDDEKNKSDSDEDTKNDTEEGDTQEQAAKIAEKEEAEDEEEEPYKNEDENCEGPEMLFCPGATFPSEATAEMVSQSMLRMMLVKEEASVYRDYHIVPGNDESNSRLLPSTMQELVQDLQSLLST